MQYTDVGIHTLQKCHTIFEVFSADSQFVPKESVCPDFGVVDPR